MILADKDCCPPGQRVCRQTLNRIQGTAPGDQRGADVASRGLFGNSDTQTQVSRLLPNAGEFYLHILIYH